MWHPLMQYTEPYSVPCMLDLVIRLIRSTYKEKPRVAGIPPGSSRRQSSSGIRFIRQHHALQATVSACTKPCHRPATPPIKAAHAPRIVHLWSRHMWSRYPGVVRVQ